MPVATASAIPTERVASTAKSPTAIGRDFTYVICLLIDSIATI